MSLSQITYADKSDYQSSSLANEYKVSASDMNEIKSVVNGSCTQIDNLTTYSTTETRIGTWTNGKPIYRIILIYSVSTGSTSHDISSLNIDNVISENHLCKRYTTGANIDFEGPYYSNSSDYFRVFIRANTGTIETRLQNSAATNTQQSIIEYTKTTD